MIDDGRASRALYWAIYVLGLALVAFQVVAFLTEGG